MRSAADGAVRASPRIICAMFKCPPQRVERVRRALTVDSKLTDPDRSTVGPAR